jgi:hypothetical protein
LGEFKEGDFIEVLLDNSNGNVFEQNKLIIGDKLFSSHSFQDEVDFIDCHNLGFNLRVFDVNELADFSSQS